LQNICERGDLLVMWWVSRQRASKWTTRHARPTVLQSGD